MRKAHGLSQEQLAARIGKTTSTVSQYESGRINKPARSAVLALDDALEANGELLAAFGFSSPAGEIAELRGRIEELEAHVELLLVVSGIRVDPRTAPPEAPSADG